MSRDLQDLHLQPQKFALGRFLDQDVRLHRLEFELKPEASKEFRVGNHRNRFWMTTNRALKTLLYPGDVRHVVEMPVGEEQQLELNPEFFHPGAGTVRRIKQNRTPRSMNKVAIG